MSITVEDALRLPSLRSARVIAGKAGLSNVVYGVTVFEYMGSRELQRSYFELNERYLGSSMVLSSFLGVSDDADRMCECLRGLYKAGESALVLYYVGLVMKAVPRSLMDEADRLGIPLICMPEGRVDLRYSDLINEVGEAAISNRVHYSSGLVTEIIAQVSKLPSENQTVGSVLSMLRNKLHVSVVLTDGNLNCLGEASWPMERMINEKLSEETVAHSAKKRKSFQPIPGSYIWYAPIHDRGVEPMRLFLVEEGNILNDITVDMARETVQLAVELWSNSHSAVAASELVKAILNDEPIRMRRLSEALHIDIRNIHTTWFIRSTDERKTFSKEMIEAVRVKMGSLDPDTLIEPYRNTLEDRDDLIMFFRNPQDSHLLGDCAKQVIESLHSLGCERVYLTMLDYKFTTSDVRKAFSIWNENEASARTVFPDLEIFHESEIELVRQCNEIIKLGEASIANATGCLDALSEHHSSDDFLKTLEVYFLDADMNMQRASEILEVHKNTIKYRINMVCDVLGHNVSNPIATSRLTIALSIRRLLDKASYRS